MLRNSSAHITSPGAHFYLVVMCGALSLSMAACEGGALLDPSDPVTAVILGAPEPAPVEEPTTAPDAVIKPDMESGEEVAAPPPCQPICPANSCADDGCGTPCTCPEARSICFGERCQAEAPPEGPTAALSAALIDFGTVAPGTVIDRSLVIRNDGLAPLEVTSFTIEGNATLALVQDESLWRSVSGAPITVVLSDGWSLDAAETLEVRLRFTPVDNAVQQALLTFHTNDPEQPLGTAVRLRGGPSQGCLNAQPSFFDFGPVVVGDPAEAIVQIESCGNLSVIVDYVDIRGEGAASFEVISAIVGQEIPADGDLSLLIAFVPTAQETEESAELAIGFSTPDGVEELLLAVEGVGVSDYDPVPKIVMAELSPTQPGVVVHLDGRESYAPQGGIGLYTWSVTGPPSAKVSLLPDSISPQVTSVVDVIGDYTFSLGVMDAQGIISPELAHKTLSVEPWATLHIELVWSTPADSDQYDTGPIAGTDLDLHLVREGAIGVDVDEDGVGDGWFDVEADCYWFNPFPDWGDYSLPTNDDPFLQRADADGWGPEYLVFDLPKEGMTYRIGVHAWADNGFGPSTATLRVYVLGDLKFEETLPAIEQGQLWDVASITWDGWPTATITSRAYPSGMPRVFSDVSPVAASTSP